MLSPKYLRTLIKECASVYYFPPSAATDFPRPLPPIRKIGLGRRALAGIVPTEKSEAGTGGAAALFESSLERDFYILLEFDDNVLRWDPQPVSVETPNGRGYVPDVLVTYSGPSRMSGDVRRTLYEVKYRQELAKRWKDLKPKFKAARAWARTQGWSFRIISEVEIRTPLLWNAKFLLPYRRDEPSDEDLSRVLGALAQLGLCTPHTLLEFLSSERSVQARLLPTLWYLVATRAIDCDLTKKLTKASPIRRHDRSN